MKLLVASIACISILQAPACGGGKVDQPATSSTSTATKNSSTGAANTGGLVAASGSDESGTSDYPYPDKDRIGALAADYFPTANGKSWTFDNGQKITLANGFTMNCGAGDRPFAQVQISATASGSGIYLPHRRVAGSDETVWVGAINGQIFSASDAAVYDAFLLCDLINQASSAVAAGKGCGSAAPSHFATFLGSTCLDASPGPVKVPAGEFKDTVGVSAIVDDKPLTWVFAKGVGLIQFRAGDQSVSLKSY